jgi:ribosome-associated heat shock protein Hsp15
MALRLDKYCWFVRLCKTRSISTDLISRGKIKLNGELAKPSKEIKKNDVIIVLKNSAEFSYKVLELLENRVGPKLVESYLLDITPEEEKEKFKSYQLAQAVYRNYGTGKPSKKDRKELDDFLDF